MEKVAMVSDERVSTMVLSRYFSENTNLVAGMCRSCYHAREEVRIVGVNRSFLDQIVKDPGAKNVKSYKHSTFELDDAVGGTVGRREYKKCVESPVPWKALPLKDYISDSEESEIVDSSTSSDDSDEERTLSPMRIDEFIDQIERIKRKNEETESLQGWKKLKVGREESDNFEDQTEDTEGTDFDAAGLKGSMKSEIINEEDRESERFEDETEEDADTYSDLDTVASLRSVNEANMRSIGDEGSNQFEDGHEEDADTYLDLEDVSSIGSSDISESNQFEDENEESTGSFWNLKDVDDLGYLRKWQIRNAGDEKSNYFKDRTEERADTYTNLEDASSFIRLKKSRIRHEETDKPLNLEDVDGPRSSRKSERRNEESEESNHFEDKSEETTDHCLNLEDYHPLRNWKKSPIRTEDTQESSILEETRGFKTKNEGNLDSNNFEETSSHHWNLKELGNLKNSQKPQINTEENADPTNLENIAGLRNWRKVQRRNEESEESNYFDKGKKRTETEKDEAVDDLGISKKSQIRNKEGYEPLNLDDVSGIRHAKKSLKRNEENEESNHSEDNSPETSHYYLNYLEVVGLPGRNSRKSRIKNEENEESNNSDGINEERADTYANLEDSNGIITLKKSQVEKEESAESDNFEAGNEETTGSYSTLIDSGGLRNLNKSQIRNEESEESNNFEDRNEETTDSYSNLGHFGSLRDLKKSQVGHEESNDLEDEKKKEENQERETFKFEDDSEEFLSDLGDVGVAKNQNNSKIEGETVELTPSSVEEENEKLARSPAKSIDFEDRSEENEELAISTGTIRKRFEGNPEDDIENMENDGSSMKSINLEDRIEENEEPPKSSNLPGEKIGNKPEGDVQSRKCDLSHGNEGNFEENASTNEETSFFGFNPTDPKHDALILDKIDSNLGNIDGKLRQSKKHKNASFGSFHPDFKKQRIGPDPVLDGQHDEDHSETVSRFFSKKNLKKAKLAFSMKKLEKTSSKPSLQTETEFFGFNAEACEKSSAISLRLNETLKKMDVETYGLDESDKERYHSEESGKKKIDLRLETGILGPKFRDGTGNIGVDPNGFAKNSDESLKEGVGASPRCFEESGMNFKSDGIKNEEFVVSGISRFEEEEICFREDVKGIGNFEDTRNWNEKLWTDRKEPLSSKDEDFAEKGKHSSSKCSGWLSLKNEVEENGCLEETSIPKEAPFKLEQPKKGFQKFEDFSSESSSNSHFDPNHIKLETKAPPTTDLDTSSTNYFLVDPVWHPPKSPHNLVEEDFYHDPWALLVATIFLNKTSAKHAKMFIRNFLEDYPTPFSVMKSQPSELEKYFEKIGLQTTRSTQVWRMSHDFVHKNWKDVKELFGVGKYGRDAFNMFCLGNFDVQPEDRYLKIYKAWYERVHAKKRGTEFNEKFVDAMGFKNDELVCNDEEEENDDSGSGSGGDDDGDDETGEDHGEYGEYVQTNQIPKVLPNLPNSKNAVNRLKLPKLCQLPQSPNILSTWPNSSNLAASPQLPKPSQPSTTFTKKTSSNIGKFSFIFDDSFKTCLEFLNSER